MKMTLEGVFYDKLETGLYSEKAFAVLKQLAKLPFAEVEAKTASGLVKLPLKKTLFCYMLMGPKLCVDETGQICFYGDMHGFPDKRTMKPSSFSPMAKEEFLRHTLQQLEDVVDWLKSELMARGLSLDTSFQIHQADVEPSTFDFILSDLKVLSGLIQNKGRLYGKQHDDRIYKELVGNPASCIEAERNSLVKRELAELQQAQIERVSAATADFYDKTYVCSDAKNEEYRSLLQQLLDGCAHELHEFCSKWFSGKQSIDEYVVRCVSNLRYF